MTRYLESFRAANLTFKLAEDGVHPGEFGHWLMAKSVLLYLGQKVKDTTNFMAAISTQPHAQQIYDLVNERQLLMKDAWLTTVGHKRPGMNQGIPLPEAQIK